MDNKTELTIDNKLNAWNIISWLFGIVVFAIGVVNVFWGNDAGFGVFILLLSFIYFSPLNAIFESKLGFRIPWFVKVLVGVFVLWAALGVGELFDKIDLMIEDL